MSAPDGEGAGNPTRGPSCGSLVFVDESSGYASAPNKLLRCDHLGSQW